MSTQILRVSPTLAPSSLKSAIQPAVDMLLQNVPVAIPTETVYGLAANATSPAAVQHIFRIKGRPSDNPLIVHVASREQAEQVLPEGVAFPECYQPLIEKFWPGPLTILLPTHASKIPTQVTAGLDTVGVRVPDHPIALAILESAGIPLAAPSANTSSRPSPTSAEHVFQDLEGKVEMIVDGGECVVGVESTVINGLDGKRCVLRPGGIGLEQIRTCPGWENVEMAQEKSRKDVHVNALDQEQQWIDLLRQRLQQAKFHPSQTMPQHLLDISMDELKKDEVPMSPGMKYKHYSPKAPVILVESPASSRISPSSKSNIETSSASTQSSWNAILGNNIQDRIQREMRNLKQAGCHRIAYIHPFHCTTNRPKSSLSHVINSEDMLKPQYKPQEESELGLEVIDASLGETVEDAARLLFKRLREADEKNVDAVLVHIQQDEMGVGRAVMNRLRKAATKRVVVSANPPSENA